MKERNSKSKIPNRNRISPLDSIAMAVMTRKRRRLMLQALPLAAAASSPPPTVVLPEELIIEILSRVPVSNPLQLRCVCKSWKFLVSDPQFVKNHLHRSITDINDLASKALEDMNAFELQLNFEPTAAEDMEDTHSLTNEVAQLDNLLVTVQSLKGSLEIIKVDVQEIKDRMKCLQSFLQIYLKTASSSSATSQFM